MVGFFCESSKTDVSGGALDQLKSKSSNDPEIRSLIPEDHSTDFDVLPLTSLEPFVDFDFIQDWIEDIQVPDCADYNTSEIGSGLGDIICFEDPIVDCFRKGMDDKEIFGSVKVECLGANEIAVKDSGVIAGKGKSDGFNECSLSDFVKAELGSAEMNGSGVGILGSLNCTIEEGLEKVSLIGGTDDVVMDVKGVSKMDSKVVTEDAQSDTESESESESGTSSSSSAASSSESSSSSESDDDTKEMVKERKVDVEDGEIMDSDVEKMVCWTDNGNDDDDAGEDDSGSDINPDLEFVDDIDDEGETDLPKGPIRSKNELEDLPLVPEVTASLQPGQQILPVGSVSAVLGTKVIVEGAEKHNPISESSILWITERRVALGIIDEIFGPVKTPYYVVRYNSEGEVPSDIPIGTAIGFVSEFAGHVLNDKSLYQKGYDASGENDEEIDEVEFSDDEKEAEYRRMLKMSKRGNNNESQGPGNKKNRKNIKSRENTWTKNQPSTSQSPAFPPSHPDKTHLHVRSPSPRFSQGNQSGTTMINPAFTGGSSHNGPVFPGGPNTFTQMPQSGPGLLNGNRSNGMPPHPQNMAISGSFQPNANWTSGMPPQHQNMANTMPWMMQQNYPPPVQMPPNIPFPWQHQQQVPQQQFDLSQLLSGINGSPLGPMNFNMGGPNAPWSGMLGQNFPGQVPFLPGVQNPNGQFPMFQGFVPNGPQTAGVSTNSMPATSFSGNEAASSQTQQGVSSGRGRGRKPFQQRGGRFGGRRGR